MALRANYATEELQSKDRAHNIHPFTDLSVLQDEVCTVYAEAEGAYVYDSDGNRLIDGISGLWCVNIGHGREEMAQAIADQIRRLTFYSSFGNMTNPPTVELAAKIASLAPGTLNHVFFSTSGSSANETAIRVAQHYFNRLGMPAKKHVISREEAYHGSSYLTASLCGSSYHKAWDVAANFVHHLPAPDTYRRPAGTTLDEFCDAKVKDLEDKILELGPENVACFIAEPIMGAGGVIVPPPGYQRRTLDVCRKYGVLYISDEVVTGFGRLGHMFASEPLFDLVPDILTCAKGISSGYVPLSATILSDEIYDVISAPGETFFHGYTYTGHPVACVAGLKNIEIIEREGICERVRQTGPYLQRALEGLLELELVGDVRGSHFMMAIEYVADRETRAPLSKELDVGKRIGEKSYARGLVVRPLGPGLSVLSPVLIIGEAEIDRIVEIMRDAIRETMDDLVRDGDWKPNG